MTVGACGRSCHRRGIVGCSRPPESQKSRARYSSSKAGDSDGDDASGRHLSGGARNAASDVAWLSVQARPYVIALNKDACIWDRSTSTRSAPLEHVPLCPGSRIVISPNGKFMNVTGGNP